MSGSSAERIVGWSPELTAAYVGSEAPPQASCNSMLLEVVALADRIVGGTDMMTADRAGWRTPARVYAGELPAGVAFVDDDRAAIVVGQYVNAADLRGTDDRATMALALVQVAREIHAESARGAGIIQLAPGVLVGGIAACLLVGIAVGWYAAGGSTATQAARVRHAGIAEAGRLASERVRVAAQTGQPIAPPGPVEMAAADDIRAAATAAREAGIGQQVSDAVGTLAKTFLWLGAGIAAVTLWQGAKGR